MAKGFTHKKRRTNPDGPGPGRPRKSDEVKEEAQRSRCSRSALASLLWSESYKRMLDAEASERPELVELVEQAVKDLASTYEHPGLRALANRVAHQAQVARRRRASPLSCSGLAISA